jgi:alkylated DNA repair dioxygenase AlkB
VDVGYLASYFQAMQPQIDLFAPALALPDGFRYRGDLLTRSEQAALIVDIAPLAFREFEFHGFLGKRRVVHYGWKYDFSARSITKTDDIPTFLLPLRERAANFAGLSPDSLQQVLVTEYSPGAAIGWHKDKAVFGEVVGISLLSPCTFRLRRRKSNGWERCAIIAEPGSAYLIAGQSRTEWEHSIPPVEALRYSVTFRNFRDG